MLIGVQLTLAPLSDEEYADFAERQVVEYARQNVNAGEWAPEEALQKARQSEADLLADTLRGQGHEFFKGMDGAGWRVGWLWIAPAPGFLGLDPARSRWLSQITVEETLRGQGYGRALLEAMHAYLAEQGVEDVWLRVFDWNEAARRLYAGMGYDVVRQFETDAHMRKRL